MPFFEPSEIAERVSEALANREAFQDLRAEARETVVAGFALRDCLARQRALIGEALEAR